MGMARVAGGGLPGRRRARPFLRALLAVVLGAPALQIRASDTEAGFRWAVGLYRDQDKLLPAAVHYAHTNESPDGGRIRHEAWTREDGTLFKAAAEQTTAAGSELSEYSLDDGTVYFHFHRKSRRQPDGGLRVEEERKYWAAGDLVRWTRRSATFPPGAEPDLRRTPMDTRSLINLSNDDRRVDLVTDAAHRICVGLKEAFPPEHDPAAGAAPEWKRIRLIKGTASPDGRYQFAWSPNEPAVDWSAYADEDGEFTSDEGKPLTNYVADLQTHRIAGATLGRHFGTRQRYNHRACQAAWSPDASIFVEITTAKWEYTGCCVGRLSDGKVIGCIDLGKPAEKSAANFLAANKDRAWRKNQGRFTTQIGDVEVKNDGTISLTVSGEIPKAPAPDSSYEVRVTFRLSATAKGLQLTPVGAAKPPSRE